MAFDQLEFNKITFINSGTIIASSQGLTRCLIVDSGEKNTKVIPIFEDFDLSKHNCWSKAAGELVSREFRQYLT